MAAGNKPRAPRGVNLNPLASSRAPPYVPPVRRDGIEVSIILPIHNERESLPGLLAEIADTFADRSWEAVAVDDGSTDGSRDLLRDLRARDDRLRVLALAERCGQSAALAAGFAAAAGEIVVTMDADGQNPPADARKLLAALEGWERYDAAVGYRTPRRDSRWKRVQARVANAVRNRITGDHVRDTGCSLRAVRRGALAGIPRFDGMHRFLPTLLRWAGARVVEVPVGHRPRRHGRSKYGMWDRLFRGLRDAFGVRWLRRRALRYTVLDDERG